MGKYIDAEKLIAEIELLLKRNEPYCGNAVADGQRQALYQMKDFITSIQQEQDHFADASKMGPDVDLEKFDKEVTKIWGKCAADPDDSLACFHIETFNEIARHFYGLRNRALEEAARHVYESWMGGTMDDVRRDMVELGKALNARK